MHSICSSFNKSVAVQTNCFDPGAGSGLVLPVTVRTGTVVWEAALRVKVPRLLLSVWRFHCLAENWVSESGLLSAQSSVSSELRWREVKTEFTSTSKSSGDKKCDSKVFTLCVRSWRTRWNGGRYIKGLVSSMWMTFCHQRPCEQTCHAQNIPVLHSQTTVQKWEHGRRQNDGATQWVDETSPLSGPFRSSRPEADSFAFGPKIKVHKSTWKSLPSE